jgi:two-component system, NtrC family, response regulator GlrR
MLHGGTTVVVGGAKPLTVRRLSVRVIDGPDAGRTLINDGDQLVIGTHEGAQLVLTDPAVSRFHCQLELGDERVLLRDLESKNRTRLDGVTVLVAEVRDGSQIEIGRSKLDIRFEPDKLELPLGEASSFCRMVGSSAPMRRAFSLLERAAESTATVLILGETGTGKEAAAEAVHEASDRADGPFVVVDCGAVPPQLLESELFGHVKGAFTGASSDRPGAFRAAHKGTLFLDEIGELELDLQPKLLRVLERRHVKKVGATSYEPVDVRIVAATHRDLRAEVNHGRFRADLYYRLAVVEIRLPPLRERIEDLPLLVEHLLESMGVAAGHPFADSLRDRTFTKSLSMHSWPGNVRELRNYLERCLALREHAELSGAAALPDHSAEPAIDASVPLRHARDQWIARFEKRYLETLLERHVGNVSEAARAAGVNRGHLYRLLSRYGLK